MHPVDGRDHPPREQCFDGMQDGTYGCENCEGIYFPSDEEVLDAASRRRRWKPASIHGLCGRLILVMTNRFVAADRCGGELF